MRKVFRNGQEKTVGRPEELMRCLKERQTRKYLALGEAFRSTNVNNIQKIR